ncbi:Leucine-Rich Repeat-Containing Protein 14B [Manis pentadactyla]|nr:Leucine-Rich Repeat-Containing Protein 14B [Manis pentadactyla]
MRLLRSCSAEALVSQPQVARRSLDAVAHLIYLLLFKASYFLEQAEVIHVLLGHWPLEEFRLSALLGPSTEHPVDLRDRACWACLEASVQGQRLEVAANGRPHRNLRHAGAAVRLWEGAGQTEPCTDQRPIQVLADLFVTDGNFKVVVQALGPIGPTPLQLHCLSFRADSLDPGQLLHVLRLAGLQELHRLELVHNVWLHAGHVQQLLTQVGFPWLASLTLPAKAFDPPPGSPPAPDSEDPFFTSISWELSQMSQLSELSVAFSTLTGKIQKLLGLGKAAESSLWGRCQGLHAGYRGKRNLGTPLRVLDLANCSLNHADMAFLAACTHATHLEVLDLSGHSLVDLFPSTFSRLLGWAAPTLRVLTLEECSIQDNHVGTVGLALSPCHRLCELRFLGNLLSAVALRHLFAALCELPELRCIELIPGSQGLLP